MLEPWILERLTRSVLPASTGSLNLLGASPRTAASYPLLTMFQSLCTKQAVTAASQGINSLLLMVKASFFCNIAI